MKIETLVSDRIFRGPPDAVGGRWPAWVRLLTIFGINAILWFIIFVAIRACLAS